MCWVMLVAVKAVRAYNGYESLFKGREGFFRGREIASAGVHDIAGLVPGALKKRGSAYRCNESACRSRESLV